MSRTKSVCGKKLSLENIKYKLLIVKCSETLILKTTKYWDKLRTVLDLGGRVIG